MSQSQEQNSTSEFSLLGIEALTQYHEEIIEGVRAAWPKFLEAANELQVEACIDALIGGVVAGFKPSKGMNLQAQTVKTLGRVFAFSLVIAHVKGVSMDKAFEEAIQKTRDDFKQNINKVDLDLVGKLLKEIDNVQAR